MSWPPQLNLTLEFKLMTKIGNYDIISKISEGSFGITYKAKHSKLGKLVCAKQEATGDTLYQKWFREEAMLLWDINHPSLPTLKDYIETNDEQMIVMSFINGDSIDKVVKKNGCIDEEHICWILQRLLDALSYLHYNGVIHCDIKPQNIILNFKEHNAILVDFGLCTVGSTANTQPKGGTEYYMPPEFELGKPPLPASDIYSLGKIAIYLSGGNVATGTNKLTMLKDLVAEMIRYDPLARPQTANEILSRIVEIRRKTFGRTSTLEEIKFVK